MTLRITAIESEPAPVMFPPRRGEQLAFVDLEGALELPAFLPTSHRRYVRAILADAAAQLARMEQRQ
jgi:hypothetical protein